MINKSTINPQLLISN